ncbi:hypothetical protein [Nocardia harenae]|uniref:hypothetical protein n=1 Tax=Nocardia harenae TaxID=358707 RepID=UPI000830477A|nr:hypothetical protein [Nocardia harenae]
MDFSIAEFEEIISQIENKLDGLESTMNSVPTFVGTGTSHWWVSDAMADVIRWTGDKIYEFCQWLLRTVRDLLEGAAAPVYMAVCAKDWFDIRGAASQVAGNVDPNVLRSTAEWQGSAQFAYRARATAHNAAAKRIGDVAKDSATALIASAGAGLVFYGALLGILVKATIVVTTGLGGIASGVFSWAGAALIAGEAASDSASIVAAITALTALLSAQAATFAALETAATDNSVWVDGKWPDSLTSGFDNGTRLDGTAEWSIR